MKVGTDAVLLGAWVNGHAPVRILDIGTGCGLIALMLAQRYNAAQIEAIDIDEASIAEASTNFAASPWSERLKAIHAPLQHWESQAYDLIVSNPPYFSKGFPITKKNRAMARNQETLNFETLLTHVKRLLKTDGKFALVLPISAKPAFENELKLAGFYCQRQTEVLSFESKNTALILLEVGFKPASVHNSALCIRRADGAYHADYLSLTRDFYLFS